MTKVFTGASVSLDGYISGPAETGFEHLFTWYGNGDVEVPTANPEMTLRMSAVSAEHFRNIIDMTGALVVGRKLFDSTNAWGGKHPMDRLVVVVTRTDLGRRGHQRHGRVGVRRVVAVVGAGPLDHPLEPPDGLQQHRDRHLDVVGDAAGMEHAGVVGHEHHPVVDRPPADHALDAVVDHRRGGDDRDPAGVVLHLRRLLLEGRTAQFAMGVRLGLRRAARLRCRATWRAGGPRRRCAPRRSGRRPRRSAAPRHAPGGR